MDAWFTSVCQTLSPALGNPLSIVCAVLAMLVLAAIGLGFGPLRVWLGLSPVRHASGHGATFGGDGVREMWRLYRALGRAESRSQ